MSEAQPPHALLRPRIAIPYLLISLIWGSTWWVITGQISGVPTVWAVAFRFLLASAAMIVLALATGKSLRLAPPVHALAATLGLFQFCANFNFVYLAEQHLTSGIVAVMIAMAIIPNAVLGRVLLGQPITARFAGGSAIALAGIACLLINEAQTARLGGDVGLGIWQALAAMLAASTASVVQANPTGRSVPMTSLLAWSMVYGTALNLIIALATAGVPELPSSASFWAGTAYLALLGSVTTFPLYWGLVREIGAGRAAYHGVAVVIVAMLLSTVLEGYGWSMLAVSGALLSLVGLIVALRARRPAK